MVAYQLSCWFPVKEIQFGKSVHMVDLFVYVEENNIIQYKVIQNQRILNAILILIASTQGLFSMQFLTRKSFEHWETIRNLNQWPLN